MSSFEKKNKREDVYRRLALLNDFLYEHTSEEYCVSAEQILRYWKQNGVEVDNIKTVYKALNILKDEMDVKIEYNYGKKGHQLAEQLIQLIKSECEKKNAGLLWHSHKSY